MTFPPPAVRRRGKSRWIGRSQILKPDSPPWCKYLVLTVSMLGLQLVWSCEMAQASPYLLSLGLSKSMMAIVFLAGPLSGLIVQPLVGVLSDGCKSSLGRRKPFIIGGCIVTSLAVMLLGWTKEVAAIFTTLGGTAHSRLTIALAILSVYIIDFSINVVQAMDRSLLVDVVPPPLQAAANAWASRMFGFGAVLGYWIGGLDLVYLSGGYFGGEQLKVLTLFTSFFLCFCHAITVTFVSERVLISKEDDSIHAGEGSTMKAIHEIWDTFKTLPRPIQQVLNVQFSSWVGWFPILFFSTTWVAEIYVRTHSSSSDLASAPFEIRELATRAGTRAMLFHSIVSLSTSIFLPFLIAPFSDAPTPYIPTLRLSAPIAFSKWRSYLPEIPIPWLSLSMLWTLSNGVFSILLLSTWFASSVGGASVIIAAAGFSWAVTNWAPFALLGDLILRIDPSSSIMLQGDSEPWARPLSPVQEETSPELHSLLFSSSAQRSFKPKSSSSSSGTSTPLTEEAMSKLSTPPSASKLVRSPLVEQHESEKTPKAGYVSPSQLHSSPSASSAVSDDFFDTTMETPKQPSRILFEDSPSPEFEVPSLRKKSPHPSQNQSLPTSNYISNHPYNNHHSIEYPPDHRQGSFDSDSSLNQNMDHDPYYSSTSTIHLNSSSTKVLQIRHSDESDRDDIFSGSGRNGNRNGSGNNSRNESRTGSGEGFSYSEGLGIEGIDGGDRLMPGISLEDGTEWDSEKDLEDEGRGDQAGVILGCHNIYLVLPQFLVTAFSSIIFALFAPHHSVIAPVIDKVTAVTSDSSITDSLGDLVRRVAEESSNGNDWDALGMIFRIGGVSAAISTYICWKMTRERDMRNRRSGNVSN